MATKLTLTMEDKVIDSAKKYAKKSGKSLSHLVETYLKSIATKEPNDAILSQKVSKLMGVIKLPDDYDFTNKGKPLTDKERKAISEFIKADKEKNYKTKASQSKVY